MRWNSPRGSTAMGWFAVVLLIAGCNAHSENASTAVKEELDKLREQNEKYRLDINKLQDDVIKHKREAKDFERERNTAQQAKDSIEQKRKDTADQLANAHARLAAPYIHTVIFHLKADAPVKEMIADAHGMLAKIPSVYAYWVGKPAEKASPEFADKSFQLGLAIHFENFEGLTLYLEHEKHKQFVEKYLKHCEKVTVYDTLADAPK